jgi:hypothetical protein
MAKVGLVCPKATGCSGRGLDANKSGDLTASIVLLLPTTGIGETAGIGLPGPSSPAVLLPAESSAVVSGTKAVADVLFVVTD